MCLRESVWSTARGGTVSLAVSWSSVLYHSSILYESEVSGLSLTSIGFIIQPYRRQCGKGWGHSCHTKQGMALKFACWEEAGAARESLKTSVYYAWWCARQSEQKIIVSILRKDHEFQWFPEVQTGDLLRLFSLPLYLWMSLHSVVSTHDF